MKKLIDRIAIAVCGLGLLFIIISHFVSTKPPEIDATPLSALNAAEPFVSGQGFAPNAVIPNIVASVRGVPLYGSWLGGDGFTGTVHTRWYLPVHSFYLMLSGFPKLMHDGLLLEIQTPDGVRRIALDLDENPDYWRLQKVTLPDVQHTRAFRIVAADTSKELRGWLGFSEPFTIRHQPQSEIAKQLLLLILCTVACLVAFVGPGLIVRARWRTKTSPVWLCVPGILFMSVLGLLVWKGPLWVSPLTISSTGLGILFAAAGYALTRAPFSSLTTSAERRALVLLLVLIALAIAKVTYSPGPSGELYRGSISRTFEVGGRSDSRISYHIVQIVGLRKGAYSEVAKALLDPWNFSYRGPIAGVAVSPLVLASGAHLQATKPDDDAWTVFDPRGFAAYRVAMIVLGALSLFILFGLARLFLDERWALFALFVTAAAPFTVHELFFTWPKILAASFVLLSLYLLKRDRPFFAGLAVGVGYLCHPSALLWFPWLLIAIPLLGGNVKLAHSLRRAVLACAGLSIWILLWRFVNRGHFQQTGFFDYFHQVGALPLTARNWVLYRLDTALDTLVPFYMFLFHRADPSLISADGMCQPWVQFVQQYWCCLPFACGLLFYFVLQYLAFVALKRAFPWMAFVFAPAILLFIAYFGAPNTGLMREGMHAWFLGFLLFAVIIWQKYRASAPWLWTFATAALLFRSLETLAVLVPFASWTRGYIVQPQFALSDSLSLLVIFAGTGYLAIFAVLQCRSLAQIGNSTEATSCKSAAR